MVIIITVGKNKPTININKKIYYSFIPYYLYFLENILRKYNSQFFFLLIKNFKKNYENSFWNNKW